MTRTLLRYIAGAPLLVVGGILVAVGMGGEIAMQLAWGCGTTLVDWGRDYWGLVKWRW